MKLTAAAGFGMGPAAGQSIMYFRAPWGLQMELISYPDGMACEAESERVLWSPAAD